MTQVIDKSESPNWANWLGIMTIVFGILLTAMHGTELTRQYVLEPDSAAVREIPPRCPEYELEKDGLSVEYCQAMAAHIKSQIVATPIWFRELQIKLSATGIIVALISVYVGIALIDNRSWAAKTAVVIFSTLILIDITGFLAVYNSGPLLRSIYLWNIFLWLAIHFMMIAAVFAGIHEDHRLLTSSS